MSKHHPLVIFSLHIGLLAIMCFTCCNSTITPVQYAPVTVLENQIQPWSVSLLSSKWAGQTITVKIVLQNIGDGPIALPNAYVFRVLDAYGSWWIPKEQYQNKSMYPTDTYNLTLTFSPNPKAGDLWLVVLWPTVDYFGQQKLFDIGTPPE